MTKKNLLKKIAAYLTTSHQMVTAAESCTGGLLAAALTTLPGSSKWFDRGFVTYSNAAKTALLGVSEKILTQHGAVSHETAQAMAEGALKNSQAQITIAITGIAGPEGGSLEKPIGTVWFAVTYKNRTFTHLEKLDGSRDIIRKKSSYSWLKFTASNPSGCWYFYFIGKKSMKKIRLLGVTLLFLFTLPIFADTIPVYTEANTNITQSSNQPVFIIRLKSNPTTGYSWSLKNYDEQNIQLLKHRYLPPTQMIAGAGGTEEWTFRLTKEAFLTPQTLSIELIYKRPWEKKGDSRRVVFHVLSH